MSSMTLDPEIAAVLMAQAEVAIRAGIVMPERGDALALRSLVDETLALTYGALPAAPDVSSETYATTGHDGAEIELRWYTRTVPLAGPAVVYVHGGGMISGTLDNYDSLVVHAARQSPDTRPSYGGSCLHSPRLPS